MLTEIYAEVTGTQPVERIDSRDFDSIDAFQRRCFNQARPALVVIQPEQVESVVNWLPAEHEICLETDPDSLLKRRLGSLSQPKPHSIDPLTKILTRRGFDEAIQLLPNHLDSSESVSLILCDLDHFKNHNDQYGHGAGDKVLVRSAQLLQATCCETDIVARFGGEKFSIVTTRDSKETATWAQELRQSIEDAFHDCELTASFGVSHGTVASIRKRTSTLYQQADEALYAAKANGRNQCVEFEEIQTQVADTGLASLENHARVLSDRVTNFIALHSRKIMERVREEAETDALTQFYTRRYFDRRFAAEVQEADAELSVAFIDLDHFGQVNKQQGWPTGDKILREVCQIIRDQIRDADWVGRYGGEEFCIVMNDTRLDEAVSILNRIRIAVEKHPFFSTSGEPVPMTLSIGAVESMDSENPLAVLERASSQALRAKRDGRNQVAFETSA